MKERLEHLICRRAEGTLTRAEERELHSLLAGSEALRRLVSRDRILDRLLRESQKPALNPDQILGALPRTPSDLAAKTMVAVARQETPTPSGLRALLDLFRSPGRLFAWPRLATVLAGAVLLISAALLIFHRHRSPFEIGRFIAVVGAPTVQHANQPGRINPRFSTLVYPGDRIDTGDSGKAEIQFKDGTTVRLNFNTAIEIPAGSNQFAALRPAEIKLRSGELWSKVQKLTNAPRFAVRTPVATAVVKGTQFGLKLRKARTLQASASITAQNNPAAQLEAVLTVQEGAVEFSNNFGAVEAKEMTASTAAPGSAPTPPVRLTTLKSFVVAGGKVMSLDEGGGGLNLYSSLIRFIYPLGWAGYELPDRPEQGASNNIARIARVWPESPAAQAGLVVGDIITHINGQPVASFRDAQAPVWRSQNAQIDLTVLHDGTSKSVSLRTTRHPDALDLPNLPPATEPALFDATWQTIEEACQHDGLKNRWRALAQNFTALLERFGDVPAIHNNLALWSEANEQESASEIAHFQAAIQVEPGNALYHYNLGMILRDIGNFERAAEEMEIAHQLNPTWLPSSLRLAQSYLLLGRSDDAIAVIESALVEHPHSIDLWRAKSFFLMTLRKYEEAIEAISKAIELEPSFAIPYNSLASIYWAQGKNDLAEAEARKAIELEPGFGGAYFNLALISMNRLSGRNYDDVWTAPPAQIEISQWRNRNPEQTAILAAAEQYFRRAVELDASAANVYVNFAHFWFEKGEIEEAEKCIQKANKLDPATKAGNDNLRAWFFALWNTRLDESLASAQEAVDARPADHNHADTLSFVYFRRGEFEASEKWILRNLDLGTEPDEEAWFHLGLVREAQNHIPDAIAAYEKTVELNPNHQKAKDALQRLRH